MTKKYVKLILFLIMAPLFSKSYSVFRLNDSYGMIDEERRVILPALYKHIFIRKDGFIITVKKNQSYTFYSNNLSELYSLPAESFVHYYSEDEYFIPNLDIDVNNGSRLLYNIKKNKTYYIPKQDKYVLNNVYRSDLSVVIIHGKGKPFFSVINRKGNIIADKILQTADEYSDGLLPVVFADGRSGFIDKHGRLVIEVPLYIDYSLGGPKIEPLLNSYLFNEDHALIQSEKGLWSILDREGHLTMIPKEYILVSDRFNSGLTIVENKAGKKGFMNESAKIVIRNL